MDTAHIEQILDWLVKNFLQVVIIFSIFIQITPVKWNPITSFANWLGKIFTKEISDSIETIQDDIKKMREDIDENEKDRIRWEVLDFANSCRSGGRHTQEEFRHIATLNDKYKVLLDRTEDKNGVFETEYKYIDALYQERLKKNDFLQ